MPTGSRPGSTWSWHANTVDGGSQDGASRVHVIGGSAVFEVMHPLNTTDDLNDFSLSIPSHIEVSSASFQHCIASVCGVTNITAGAGKVVDRFRNARSA